MEDFADFDFFFKEYYVSLYSYAHSLINNWEVSRDIASDAFEYIWKNFDRIEKATAKSYLFIYVRNRAIDYLRHQDIYIMLMLNSLRNCMKIIQKWSSRSKTSV